MIACWTTKGGSGASVVSALVSLEMARLGQRTLIVDTCGDVADLFGMSPSEGTQGFSQWCAAAESVASRVLVRVADDAVLNVRLAYAGDEPRCAIRADAAERFGVEYGGTSTVVDLGTIDDRNAAMVEQAAVSLLVMRSCYLAARRARSLSLHADGFVLIEETGRQLRGEDIEDVIGVPLVARLPWSSAIAQACDAGRLATFRHRSTKPVQELARNIVIDGWPTSQRNEVGTLRRCAGE